MKTFLIKKRKLSTIILLFMALGLTSFNSINSEPERKFWGSETNCVTTSGNGGACCTTTTCYTTYYVFWIATSDPYLSSMTMDCSGCQSQ